MWPHPPGVDHELLLAVKGFDTPADAEPSLTSARNRGLDPGHIHLPDDGMDLTAYARVVSAVPAERYCFVNSYSRAVADSWLSHLSSALEQPGVGLAGATGSWASHQDFRRYQLGLRSGYDDVFEGREAARLGFLTLARQRNPTKRDNGRLAFKAIAALDMVRDRNTFDPFPGRPPADECVHRLAGPHDRVGRPPDPPQARRLPAGERPRELHAPRRGSGRSDRGGRT